MVSRVEVRSPVTIDREEIEPLLVVRPGRPFSEIEVRRTLRNLRLSGLAAEAEVYRRAGAEGLELTVALWPEVRVTAVRIEGELPLSAERLLVEVPQRAGEPLREDRVVRGVYRLGEALEREGYLAADVRVAVSPESAAGTVEVTYRVEPGERTLVGTVEIDGLGAAAPLRQL